MSQNVVTNVFALGFPWQTVDPFLFCVHHEDFYPKGNAQLGPVASLGGRNIGSDFEIRDGWRMYHGNRVPGFPVHPHRGFETVTIVLKGLVDHSDSAGAAGRYGGGDTQWLTTGKGVQHSEMFPLVHQDTDNPLELFQIWLNLPAKSKMVEPHFKMFWREDIPIYRAKDAAGRDIELTVIAGNIDGVDAIAPPPDSWAADSAHHVAIFLIKLGAGAQWTLPAAGAGINRTLYYYAGAGVTAGGREIGLKQGAALNAALATPIVNGPAESHLLLLQGRPINEPVVSYGPFVMNTREEIEQTFADYRATEFGGWPWPQPDPVHGATRGRFAKHIGGKLEEPGGW